MYIPEKLTVGFILLLLSSGGVNSSNWAHIVINKAEQLIGFGKIPGDGGIPAFKGT